MVLATSPSVTTPLPSNTATGSSPLASRASSNWKRNIIIATLVISVTTAVLSFFAGAYFACVGYATTGLLSLSNLLLVSRLNTLQSVAESISLLKKDESAQKITQQQLQQSVADLTTANADLKLELERTKTAAGLAMKTITDLSAEKQKLLDTGKTQQASIVGLEKQIAGLKQFLASFTQQIEQIGKNSLEFDQDQKKMDTDTTALTRIETTLSHDIQQTDLAFQEQAARVSAAVTLLQDNFKKVLDEKQALEKELGQLDESVQGVEAVGEKLRGSLKALEELEATIASKEQDLQQLGSSLEKTRQEYAEVTKALESASSQYATVQQKLADEGKRLEDAQAKLDATVRQLEEKLQSYEQGTSEQKEP